MPITSVTSDPSALTLTVIGDFPVPVDRLWNAWADPRRLERFWGPPTWPATFAVHDVRSGGRSTYRMNGPNGEVARGYWVFGHVEAGKSFVAHDGFALEDGRPDPSFPETVMEVVFSSTPTGSRFVCTSTFPSLEAMERLAAMGMVEGLTAALGQLDGVLSDLRDLSHSLPATLEPVDHLHARVTREVRGDLHQVWRAYHDPALLRRWFLGPDGWTMPICEVATEVGGAYRYEWANGAGDERFGFTGEVLVSEPPRRSVKTQRLIGAEGATTTVELLLTPLPGGRTRVETTITYPSTERRELLLSSGAVEGMEASFARLEAVIAAGA